MTNPQGGGNGGFAMFAEKTLGKTPGDVRESLMAESVGFEPTVPLRAHTISSRAQSSTLATLRSEPNDWKKALGSFVAVF